jgi:hypothetical protein
MLCMQVYGVTWNPFIKDRSQMVFATWGKKHCKMWNQVMQANGSSTWQATQLSFGKYPLQNVVSAAFLPVSHALVIGVAGGEILVFEGAASARAGVLAYTSAVRSIAAHRSGPQYIAEDGSISHSGVRGMVLHKDNTQLLTAGALLVNLFTIWGQRTQH